MLAPLPRSILFPRHTWLNVQRSRRSAAAKTRHFLLKLSDSLRLPRHNSSQLRDLLLLSLRRLVQFQHQGYQIFSCQLIKSAHTD